MAPNYKAELVGLFGIPVAANPTVVMHEAAFGVLGLNWRISRSKSCRTTSRMRSRASARSACAASTSRSRTRSPCSSTSTRSGLRAALMGAVNCVVREGDRLIGDNTDGKGFMTALTQDAGVNLGGKRVVVLGAGGAARAITVELALAGAASLTVVNRSEERGRETRRSALCADAVDGRGTRPGPTAIGSRTAPTFW